MVDRHLRPRDKPAFPLPRGLTPRLLMYDRFAEERGWNPRIVDELTAEELFWLPVIASAKRDAGETVARVQAKD
jgi:hypothetical protein